MRLITIPDRDLAYYLIAYDAAGREREEGDLPSERVVAVVKQEAVTDVLLISHGWKGDVKEAVDQYNRWIPAAAGCTEDLTLLKARPGGFQPLLIGLHWPSLAFGDEEFPKDDASFAPAPELSDAELIERYADRLGDTAAVRAALEKVFAAAQPPEGIPPALPDPLQEAYRELDRAVGLAGKGPGAAPGTDHDAFDPHRIFTDARTGAGAVSYGGGLLRKSRDLLLSPLRQLSFWQMKNRARAVGEAGVHDLVRKLLEARPGVRLHLIGHSFGCIVVLAAVAGPSGGSALPRPVQSLVLLQGALSLWSCCSDIPAKRGVGGYFHSLLAEKRVAGAVVTTRSRFDRAVNWFYPLGARVAGQVSYATGAATEQEWPKYGAVGAFGLRPPGFDFTDGVMLPVETGYDFRCGRVYNLEASRFIFRGGGASGAHSDIDNAAVGHAVWGALLARPADGSETEFATAGAPPVPTAPAPTPGNSSAATLDELVRAAAAVSARLGVRIRLRIDVDPPKR